VFLSRGYQLSKANNMASPNYLLRNEAAQYVREKWGVRCAPKTLAKLACIGGGPEFRRAGRSPLYEPEQLDAWVLSRIGPPVHSTSDGG
jgi:hypothetical protein